MLSYYSHSHISAFTNQIEAPPAAESYSVPRESYKLFHEGILQNPLISKGLPSEALSFADKVKFLGSTKPCIAVNWRFAESIASLKGLEATLLNVLLAKKYGVKPQEITINTDHAQLFIFSTLIWTIDPEGEKIMPSDKANTRFFPSWDKHRQSATFHRDLCTNIYKTKDGRFFHLHGSMNPDPTLESIGMPLDLEAPSREEALKPFVAKLAAIDSDEMQRLASDQYRQAGTICWTKDEYRASDHGKSNAHVGLWDLEYHPNAGQRPGWWPNSPQTVLKRPLAGLKVLDLTRVIAAPAITRGLAEMGASVMRVTAPHLVDFSALHCDLNWGKWNSSIDLRTAKGREAIEALVLEADVVVEGYRPGVLDKWGLGKANILKICQGRARGVIYVRENCYGWNGPWSYRSGWQQISDANCGVSMEFGRAMGIDEPVTPVFPNSDYCTGVAGTSGILCAVIQRAENGGSYAIDVALNYYSQWLVNSCGTYPDTIWQELWTRNGRQVFRHYHNMPYLLPRYLKMLKDTCRDVLFNANFFEVRKSKAIGADILTVKPVAQFPGGTVELGFHVGTRTNGVDQPRWPKDLSVEIVTDSN